MVEKKKKKENKENERKNESLKIFIMLNKTDL